MATSDCFLRFLGLARKAGKLSTGEENTRSEVRSGKAKLLLLAADASHNAEKRAETLAASKNIQLSRLEAGKTELANALGTPLFAMAAVCDDGFAKALQKRLQHSE